MTALDNRGSIDPLGVSQKHINRLTAERDAARADAERLAASLRSFLNDPIPKDDPFPAWVQVHEPGMDRLRAALAAHDALTGDTDG